MQYSFQPSLHSEGIIFPGLKSKVIFLMALFIQSFSSLHPHIHIFSGLCILSMSYQTIHKGKPQLCAGDEQSSAECYSAAQRMVFMVADM